MDAQEKQTKKKRVLLVFNNLMDFTMTEVLMCLCEWVEYYATHKDIQVDLYRANKWGFERNFNEFVRYAIENDYDYFFQYDADMTGSPKIIERLMAHDKDAVGCLYYSRGTKKAQLWEIDKDDAGDIVKFWEFDQSFINKAIDGACLIPSAVRASGFTLFRVSAVKEFNYPYGEQKPNKGNPYSINGFDMDITKKISTKYGAVYTDCNPDNEVKHWTMSPVKSEGRF